jgi:head-tail adaptor
MLANEIIELISITTTTNAIGNPIETPNYRQVFANKKSVGQKEFYLAQAVNMRPEVVFEIQQSDYSGELKIRWNNREYQVIRTYQKGLDKIDLTCGWL